MFNSKFIFQRKFFYSDYFTSKFHKLTFNFYYKAHRKYLNNNYQRFFFPQILNTNFLYQPGFCFIKFALKDFFSYKQNLRQRPYYLRLRFKGVGFRVRKRQKKFLFFKLGFTHRFLFLLPSAVYFKCRKYKILLFSFDKTLLKKVAFFLKKLRNPDVYKGKGIRFDSDNVLQKSRLKGTKKRLILKNCSMTNFLKITSTSLFNIDNKPTNMHRFVSISSSSNKINSYLTKNRYHFFGLGRNRFTKLLVFQGFYQGQDSTNTIFSEFIKTLAFKWFTPLRRSLKKIYISNIRFKLKTGSHVRLRLRRRLPTRGQRSKTNARTSKRRRIG